MWVDPCAPDPADLQLGADELGLHSLAVADATSDRQRPKFTRYTGHDFLTAHAVQLDSGTGNLVVAEIAAFITPSALVTVHKDDTFAIEGLPARWDDNADLTKYGVGAGRRSLEDEPGPAHQPGGVARPEGASRTSQHSPRMPARI